ncbi:MAG: helix-turn-helix domain containing protein [Proteobacteria bacterium]|nr:helix-turn-helix domain containing protein [Pseudomonadota bacterium]
MNSFLAPQQDRSTQTQQKLLDALDHLLQTHSFEELTVARIAAQAELTTGAIYRRFKDKRALLEASFQRFLAQSQELQIERKAAIENIDDVEKVGYMIRSTLKFTIPYIPLMRAASVLNDEPSFELMLTARNTSSDWLSTNLVSSTLTDEELQLRTRFAMRTISAVIRDTLLAGPSKGQKTKAMEVMVAELTEMTAGYLQIQR